MSKADFNARADKLIDKLLAEKRFHEAASIAVSLAFINIDAEEITRLLLDAVKEWKKRNEEHR